MNKLLLIENIRPNKVALRSVDTGSKGYRDLKHSILETGIHKAITVRSDGPIEYEIIDGLSRYTACRDLGYKSIIATIINCTDYDCLTTQIKMNENATQDEYSRQIRRMLIKYPSSTLNGVSRTLHKSMTWVRENLFDGPLNTRIHPLVTDGHIKLMSAYSLSKLPVEEQPDWIDRAMTMVPREFTMIVNQRVKEINGINNGRYRRMLPSTCGYELNKILQQNPKMTIQDLAGKIGQTSSWVSARLDVRQAPNHIIQGGKLVANQIHDEVPMSPKDAEAYIKRATELHTQMGATYKEITKRPNVPLVGDATAIKDEIAMMKEFFNKTLGDDRSAYEMLHGPSISEIKIKYTITIDDGPISRKGWDHVHYNEHRAYCYGDILVWLSVRGQWNVLHPAIDCGNEFDDAIEAMAWVEEHFNV